MVNRPIWKNLPRQLRLVSSLNGESNRLCDSVLGLANNGEIRYDAGTDMDQDAFNSRQSALWTKLRKNFPQQIKDRYVALRRPRNIDGVIYPPLFSAENAMKYLGGEVMDNIGQKYYNDDAERKYINDQGATWLICCNGTRRDFTQRWLEERFMYLDSVYENGEYSLKTMVLRTNVLGNIVLRLKTYSPMWVRVNYTSSQSKKVYVSKDRFYDFEVTMNNDSENDFTIYGANNLMYVNNMESLNVSHVSIAGAEKLIEVNCSESEHIKGLELGQNKYLQRVVCNDCKRLGEEERDRHLNLSGCQNLKEVNCSNTKIATLSLPETGGVIELLDCSNSGLTSFTMKGQEYLETLDLASCRQLSSLTVENCDGLKSIEMPNTVLSSCIIRGCENVSSIDISNTKFLNTLDLQGCPNLLKLNLSGVLSTTLKDLDLTASLKLEELNISSTPYIETLTFGQYRDENGALQNYNKLKVLNCANSNIKAIRYGKLGTIPAYLDLAGLNLEYVTFDSCPSVVDIRNINLVATKSMSPFKSCVNLTSLQGNLSLTGNITHAFYRCGKLKNIHNTLNLNLTNVTHMSETFLGCTSLTWDEVKFIFSKVSDKLVSLGWRSFASCTGISGSIPGNLFARCTKVTSMDELFNGCSGINGDVPSGLFSGMTVLSNCNEAFVNTKVSGVLPTDLFRPMGASLTNVSDMFANTNIESFDMANLFKYNTNLRSAYGTFRNCKQLTCEVSAELFKDKGELTSVENFFNGCPNVYGEIHRNIFNTGRNGALSKLVNVGGFFRGTGVYGDIPAYIDETNKGIFDNLPVLENAIYCFPAGVTGSIPQGLFKNNPKLTRISGIFDGCSNLTGEIPIGLFDNNVNLSVADKLFKNCTGIDSEIPKGLFNNCTLLTDVAEMFYGVRGLRGQIPERISEWIQVPSPEDPEIMEDVEIVHEYGLFDKCKYIATASGLFANCINLRSTIPSTLFMSGGNITDLNSIFYRCWELYGQIPEELFANCRKVVRLDSAFTDCCKLGKSPLEVTEEDPYAIPPKLFANCVQLSTVNNMFSMWGDKPYGTTLRGSLPPNLFRTNRNLTSTSTMFAGCGLINGALSGDFFINNTNIKNCNSTFYGTKFESVGGNLLKNNAKIEDIREMFKGNNTVTGNAPKLWQTPATLTTECFNGCTFDDQESIPSTYK